MRSARVGIEAKSLDAGPIKSSERFPKRALGLTKMLSGFVRAAKTSDISDGTMTSVAVEGEEVLIACVGGKYYAIHNKCSHQGGGLDQGELLADRCEVMCPLHDACFDLRSGEPTAEPARIPVKVYAVRVVGDDILLGPASS